MEIKGKYKYTGEFSDDLPNGKGVFVDYENGYKYTGEMLNGKKEGKGVLEYQDGVVYEGDFKDDVFNGIGTLKLSTGRKYEGEFRDGKIKGKGKFVWEDGKIYEGEYNNCMKNGFGKYYWNKDKYYEGQWLNNRQHGKGTIYFDGKEIEGIFRFGKIITCKGNKMDNNNVEKGDLVKFTKENVTNLFDLRNENLYFCQKCNYLIDNPVKCTNCNVNYCSKCVEDENKQEIPCVQCKQTNYENHFKRIKIKILVFNNNINCPNNY